MELTRDFLSAEGVEWFDAQSESDVIKVLQKLDKEGHMDWANWFIVRNMTKKQCISYAIFAAAQVIDIYEKRYPDDNRPRQAIDAAKKYLKYPSRKNAAAAHSAADKAASAYYLAHPAHPECYAYIAAAASYAAAAPYSTSAPYSAAHSAADAWASKLSWVRYPNYAVGLFVYYADAKKKMQRKILNYGIKLIRGGIK
ncbi:MAG: hypothetical protein GY865_14080 [candidate division Zixibacteria bacterium]|nr:hypothetical protein [candidate division Zixibacteria bacterium]